VATTITWRRGAVALSPARRPRPRPAAGMLIAAAMPVVLPLLTVVLLLGAFAVGGVADPTRPARIDALPAVNAFIAAVNAGDASGAAAVLDPAVLYQGVLVCWPEPCHGRTAVAGVLEAEIDDRTAHVIFPATAQETDGRVRLRGEARYASLVSAERVVYELRAEVGPDGIRDLRLVLDDDDGPTARVLADLARVRDAFDASQGLPTDGGVYPVLE
jgi:hypothetical protein